MNKSLRSFKCIDCGVETSNKQPNALRCPGCSKINKDENAEKWYLITSMRRDFAVMSAIAPEEAKEIQTEMEILEGREFREMALDGIFERVKEGGYRGLKHDAKHTDRKEDRIVV